MEGYITPHLATNIAPTAPTPEATEFSWPVPNEENTRSSAFGIFLGRHRNIWSCQDAGEVSRQTYVYFQTVLCNNKVYHYNRVGRSFPGGTALGVDLRGPPPPPPARFVQVPFAAVQWMSEEMPACTVSVKMGG